MSKKTKQVQHVNAAVLVPLPVFVIPGRRRTRLNGSCAVAALLTLPAAMSVGIMLARPAQAQTIISSDQSSTAILDSYGSGNPFLITPNTTISAASGDGVYGNVGTNWTMTNYGVVVGGTDNGIGFQSGGTLVNGYTGSTFGTISGKTDGVYVTGAAGTVDNYGLITGTQNHGIELVDGGTVTNQGFGTIIGADSGIVMFAAGYVNNEGTVSATNTNSAGIDLAAGGEVYSDGLVVGHAVGISLEGAGSVANYGTVRGAVGLSISGGAGSVYNEGDYYTGLISGSSKGVVISSTNGSIFNNGIILGSSDGVQFTGANGSVANNGLISAMGTTGVGVYVNAGSISNTGQIFGGSTGVSLAGGGYVANNFGGTQISGSTYGIHVSGGYGSIGNTGTIIGGDTAVLLDAGGSVYNARQIVGGNVGVEIGGGNATLINTGYVYPSRLGYISGGVDGVLITSANADVGNGGGISGGTVGVYLRGGGVVTNVYPGAINGTLGWGVQIGYGGNVAANTGTVYNSGFISGGVGGVLLAAGGTITNLETILGGSYGISITGGAGTVINVGDLDSSGPGLISGSSAGVVITTADAFVENVPPVYDSSGTIAGGGYGVELTQTGGSVLNYGLISAAGEGGTAVFADDGTVVNYGGVIGNGFGVRMAAGGDVYNGYDGVISGATAIGIDGGGTAASTIFNGGLITGTAYGVNLSNGPTGTFEGSGTVDTVLNFGTILQTSVSPNPTAGIFLGSDGGVYNGASQSGFFGTLTNANTLALIQGTAYGVLGSGGTVAVLNAGTIIGGTGSGVKLQNDGFVENFGTILGAATGVTVDGTISEVFNIDSYNGTYGTAYISGSNDGVLLTGAQATMVNIGTVVGYDSNDGNPTGTGVSLGAGGQVFNFTGGSFGAALITGADYGVHVSGAPGLVINNGYIHGTNTAGTGVELSDGGYVSNSSFGTIQGGAIGVGIDGAGSVASTVVNNGLITGTAYGVNLSNGPSGTFTGFGTFDAVINLGTILQTAGSPNPNAAVGISGEGGVYNGISQSGFGTLGGGNTLALIAGTTYGVLGSGGTLVVLNTGTIIGAAGSGVLAQADGIVENAGTILGGLTGITVGGTIGEVLNINDYNGTYGTAFISGANDGVLLTGTQATMVNIGTVVGYNSNDGNPTGTGVSLGGGGLVLNFYGETASTVPVISGAAYGVNVTGGTGDVFNDGYIVASNNGGTGVALGAGGFLSNSSFGTIQGGAIGVAVGLNEGTVGVGYGEVANAGSITGGQFGVSIAGYGAVNNASGAYIRGNQVGVYIAGAGATVANYGTITTAAFVTPSVVPLIVPFNEEPSVGVSFANGGNVTNYSGGFIYGSQTGISITGGTLNTVINDAGGTIVGANNVGVDLNGGNDTLDNAGAIYGFRYGAVLHNGGTVYNSGLIAAANIGSFTTGISLTQGGYVANTSGGVIYGYTVGIEARGAPVTIANAGTILAPGEGNLGEYTYQGVGVYSQAGGTLTNSAGGLIAGRVDGIVALGTMGVVNSGSIVAINGVYTDGVSLQTGSVTNYGFITGDDGVAINYGNVLNAAGGTIAGFFAGVSLSGSGADSVGNAGTITAVSGYGAGVYLHDGGTVTNTGLIASSAYGVYVHANSGTVTNSGTITESSAYQPYFAAVYLYDGGVLTNQAGGTIVGASTGVLVSQQSGTITNDGLIEGIGYDGVSLNHGGSVVNSSTGGIIGGHIGVYTGYAGASVNNYGYISGGGGGDGVSMYKGGQVTNHDSAAIFGGYAGVYIYGAASSVQNAGFISGAVSGILAAGGSITNTGSAVIFGSASGVVGITNPVYLNNSDVIIGVTVAGVSLAAGGTITNSDYIGGGGSGVIIDGVPAFVNNYGGIIGRGTFGVELNAGGYVVNQTGAEIYGDLTGVAVYGGVGTLVNNGSIYGRLGEGVLLSDGGNVTNLDAGSISSEYYAVRITGGSGTVVNSGVIFSDQSGNANYAGVSVQDGGRVINEAGGLIVGYGRGVNLGGVAATLINAGSIYSYHNGVYGSASTIGIVNMNTITGNDNGVLLTGTATVVNTAPALIEGGNGVLDIVTAYVGNAGTIFGTAGTGVLLDAGGTVDNMNIIGGTQYGVGIRNAAGTLINSGAIGQVTGQGGTNAGVYLGDGGYINNSGLIGAENTGVFVFGTANVINSGTISGSLQSGVILYGGMLVNTASGTITGIGNVGARLEGTTGLDNSGLISNIGNGANGVDLDNGLVVNRAGGTISGAYGVSAGSGTVLNAGLINATGGGVSTDGSIVANYATGRIIGGNYGVAVYTSVGTVGNAGTIIGGTGFGVKLVAGGTVTNYAGGLISGAEDGVELNDPGTVDNSGTITGNTGVGIAADFGTIVNTQGGTITGSYAGVSSYKADVTNAGYIEGAEGVGAYGINVTNMATGRITGTQTGIDIYVGSYTVANAGTITGMGSIGVKLDNGGYVNNLAGGAITGTEDGVLIDGVGTVMNAGQISSNGTNFTGVELRDDGLVENSGLITAGGYGVSLDDEGTLVNMTGGKITSAYVGVYSDYGTVINAGTIFGTGTGMQIYGGTLTNMAGGTIKGGAIGLYAGYGAVVTNAGLIADDVTAGAVLGNDVTLTNVQGGTISGVTGVAFDGTNSTVFNAGTLASTQDGGNAVYFSPSGTNYLTLSTGSKLIGLVDGGGSDSEIDLIGTGTLNNTISNFGTGSALNVETGANWTVATVTNDGTFQGGQLNKPLSLTGDFVQASLATLRVVVTPTLSSQFLITGTAQLAGTLTYVFAPGYYAAHTYDFLTATDGVTGDFANVNYSGQVPAVLTHTTNSTPANANLVLAGNGIVTPEDDSLFNEQSQAMADSAQQANTSLLGKASQGAGAGSSSAAACAAEQGAAQNTATGNASTASRMASAVASAFCGAGGWIEATGTEMDADSSGGAPDFHADTGGFLAGIDKLVNNLGTRIGLAVGYDETWLHDGGSGKGSIDTARVGLYASQPVGRFTIAGDFLYGHGDNTSNRATGIGQARATYGTDIFSGGVQASTEMALGPINLVPAAGLRIAHLSGGGFAETGSGFVSAFAVNGNTGGYTSIQPFVNVGISHNFLTGTGLSITPSLGVGYTYEAGDRGKSIDLAANNLTFTAPHNTLDAGTAVLSAGIAAGRNNWSLYAHYTAYVSGNWTSQTAEAGLQVRF